MKVMIVFDGDPETPDPEAGHPEGIVRGEFLPAGMDVLIFYREWGDQFEGGSRTHMLGGGSWENLSVEQIREVLDTLNDL